MKKILTEAQNYEQMFNTLMPYLSPEGKSTVEDAIKWSRKVLRRKDRIVWFMRHLRAAFFVPRDQWQFTNNALFLPDLSPEVKSKLAVVAGDIDATSPSIKDMMSHLTGSLTHFMGLANNIPALNNIVFDRQPVLALLDQMEKIEDEWKKTRDEQVHAEESDEIVLSFPDGFAWINLHRSECPKEGDAMGHCGNQYGDYRDTILSLRKKMPDGSQRPSLTFILDKDGDLGEMKGRANEKPAAKYHPYIIELLKQPFIRGIVGGGHDPMNNFAMSDLTPEQRTSLYDAKPSLMDSYSIWQKFPSETDMIDRKLRQELDMLDDVPEFEGIDAIGDEDVFVLKQGADHWYQYLTDYTAESVADTIRFAEEGSDSIDTYEGWVESMMDKLPGRLSQKIVEYVVADHADEIRSTLGLDEDDDITDTEVAKYIEGTDEPSDVHEAFLMGYDRGHQDGCADDVRKAIKSCAEQLDNIEFMQRPDGKWVAYIPIGTICHMVASYPEDVVNWGNDELPEIDEPHNGWEGFSVQGLLDGFLETCPEELKLEPVSLRPMATLTRADMLRDMATMRGMTPERAKERFADYDDSHLRATVSRARENYYGFSDNDPVTESFSRRVRSLMEAEQANFLHDVASVRVNDPDADFWIARRGSQDAVGKPTREFSPEAFGIKVQRPDVVLPDYLFYAMQYLHSQGYWKPIATGSLRLVNIRAKDVRDVRLTKR